MEEIKQTGLTLKEARQCKNPIPTLINGHIMKSTIGVLTVKRNGLYF